MRARKKPRAGIALALWLAVALAACVGNGRTPGVIRPAATTAGPAATPGQPLQPASPVAVATPTATALLQPATPAGPAVAGPVNGLSPAGEAITEMLLARLPEPEDVTTGAGGALYFSGYSDGTVRRYAPDGSLSTVCRGLNGPEGIVVLPDGGLVVAEQGANRISLCVAGKPNKVLLQLQNRTGQLGVDGIALDGVEAGGPWLVVPDSANGTILRASLDGREVRQIGQGFVRPVAAWVEKDGSILVADEFGLALKRLRRDGTVEIVARLATPDDVVEDGRGNIYVTTLGDKAVHMIARDGGDRTLAAGLGSPQGLALDAQGNLVVADAGRGQLTRIKITH